MIFYVILIHFFHLQARDEHQPRFVMSCDFQQDKPNNSIQFSSVEQLRGVHSHSTNYTYASFQYKQALYNRSGSVTIANHAYPVTREDYVLIEKICLDNPDKNKDELWKALLQCSFINDAAILMKGIQPFQYVKSDIYINKAHFKAVSAGKHRIEKIEKAAKDAMSQRHKSEKDKLDANYKAALKIAKKKSKAEENKVASNYKRSLADLNARHDQESKHPLGIQQPKKSVVGSSQSQSQVTQQA